MAFEECLLSLRELNNPLDKELWDDWKRYIRSMLASPEGNQKLRGKELIQRMSLITKKANKALKTKKNL